MAAQKDRVKTGRTHRQASLRRIPSVEKILQSLGSTDLPRPFVVALVRGVLSRVRTEGEIPSHEEILGRVDAALSKARRTRIQPVLNGTGILIHTNLGRVPLGERTLETLRSLGRNYSNLEFDLEAGERGGRAAYLEQLLALICQAEAATMVNNGAAALVLALRHFTAVKREVVISRGELVQIGGGFRIPEILESSGAVLREVGTTNKTSLRDYEKAMTRDTGLILKVHRSNFFMDGFVDSPRTDEIAEVARRKRVPFMEDLGSGAVIGTETIEGLEHEPTPKEVLRAGVDLICFSGDKLLGGPQAGILAGKSRHVRAIKKAPWFRVLRCDKLVLGALQNTVELYLEGNMMEAIPVLTMARMPMQELARRAAALAHALGGLPASVKSGEGQAQMGGGTLPRSRLPSVTLDIRPNGMKTAELARVLRHSEPPVIGYLGGGWFRIDLRTIFPEQDQVLSEAISRALKNGTTFM